MKFIDIIAGILLIIGGLNWGLVAFNFNAVEWLLGAYPEVVKAIYGLVGLSAVWQIFQWKAIQHRWRCGG